MTLVLEGAHSLERDRAADMDVRRGDVDPELDAQRPAQLQLRLQAALGEEVHRVPREGFQAHRGLDYPRTGAVSDKDAPAEAAAHPQAQTSRPPLDPRRPGPGVVHLRTADVGGGEDPAARPGEAAHAGQHLRLRGRRTHAARDPARLAGARRRAVQGDLAVDEARDRRDRGQALLRAPRRRRAGHGARPLGRRHQSRRSPGRIDDHPAVRQAGLSHEPEVDRPEAGRGSPRLAARASVDEGPDPHRLPEHGLLRERRLRGSAGLARLLRPQREHAEPGRVGAAGRDPAGPEPVGSGRSSRTAHGPPQPRSRAAVRAGLSDRRPVPRVALDTRCRTRRT